MRGNSCQVKRHMKQWRRLPQEVGPQEAGRAWAVMRHRWFPSKGRGGVPKAGLPVPAEIKHQETLGDAFEGAQLSSHCSEWDSDMVPMVAMGENRHA